MKQSRKQNRTSYSLYVFINKEDAGMISEFIDYCRNCILRASKTWFCGDISVAQTSNYITDIIRITLLLLNISAI